MNYINIFKHEELEEPNQKKLQKRLADFYKNVLSCPLNFNNIPDSLEIYQDIRDIENAWNVYEEDKIKHISLPNRQQFFNWYKEVNTQHKQKVASFFNYLAEASHLEDLAFYICLEEKVDGSFDDMIALAQLGVLGKAKMVMAENYWDEMGNGHEELVHTTMFAHSANFMKNLLTEKQIDITHFLPVAALKNGNMLMMYALRRRYIPRLLGAIGILEDTASERFQATVRGLERFKLSEKIIRYHRSHIQIDSKHGEEWLKNVLQPSIMAGSSEYLQEVCKGILIRFNIAIEYYHAIESAINLQQFYKKSEAINE